MTGLVSSAAPSSSGRYPSGRELLEAMGLASRQTEQRMEALLPTPARYIGRVQEAARYAVFAGGKRLRPFLVKSSSALFGVSEDNWLQAAAAVEMVHTYSLVHDDLPCMDDDTLRRGKPTTHVQFDEATALLAGDALLTLAFEVLSQPAAHADAGVRCALIAKLAQAGGTLGMIGGQMMDMEAPNSDFGYDEILTLQKLKTGALFEFCCEAGPILGGASEAERALLRDYAADFGLVFQISDDLIDATGDAGKAGKTVGKDEAQGKATLISLLGLDAARAKVVELAEQAAARLDGFGSAADSLRGLPFMLIDRES
ncbi:farnesyl-diphosphate synthase [Nitrospirillum amazonense]|uniref:Farnesyl-diphosphate synthase n=2 Tax=Azospirillaceae TaxID=2829815 RepID=A0A560FT14_9PROT|nr:farnesyl-diphosphate synthase [Nitrospirillum amazonense]